MLRIDRMRRIEFVGGASGNRVTVRQGLAGQMLGNGSKLKEGKPLGAIVGAFYAVYNGLGYGFMESLYMAALERELRDRGHGVARELYVPVKYRGGIGPAAPRHGGG